MRKKVTAASIGAAGRATPKPLLTAFKRQAAPLLAALERHRRTALVQAETGEK